MSSSMTVDEWYAELAKLAQSQPEEDDGYMTASEIEMRSGHCHGWVKDRLREAKRAGRLLCKSVHRESLSGRMASVPAYKIVPAKKK